MSSMMFFKQPLTWERLDNMTSYAWMEVMLSEEDPLRLEQKDGESTYRRPAHLRLEEYRYFFHLLNPSRIAPSASPDWAHLIELFWIIGKYLEYGPDNFPYRATGHYPQFEPSEMVNVTRYMKGLGPGMTAYAAQGWSWMVKVVCRIGDLENLITVNRSGCTPAVHRYPGFLPGQPHTFGPSSAAYHPPRFGSSSYNNPRVGDGSHGRSAFQEDVHYASRSAYECTQSTRQPPLMRAPQLGRNPDNSQCPATKSQPYGNCKVLPSTSNDRSPSEFNPCLPLIPSERQHELTLERALEAMKAGIDPTKYLGGITDKMIADRSIPDWENCALRITNVHPDSDHKEFFDMVRTGKVYAYSRHEPGGEHTAAAVNLIFTTRRGAWRFWMQCRTPPGVWIRGLRLHCIWNRDKCGPAPNPNASRVIRVIGPEDLISIQRLEGFFHMKFYWIRVEAYQQPIGRGRMMVDYYFSSLRCQGEFGHMAITREWINGEGRDVQVHYRHDPCDQ